MKTHLLGAVCTCAITLVSASADGALVSKLDGQVVYDTDRDITWLADANLAASNTFGLTTGVGLGTHPSDSEGSVSGIIIADGRMNWPGALHWIDAMNAHNGGNGYLGFNNWRLPMTLIPDTSCTNSNGDPTNGLVGGFDCTGSEMGHLFYDELGADRETSVLDTATPNELAKFSNIQSAGYWSSEEHLSTSAVWSFRFQSGNQGPSNKHILSQFAWAVHDGDIGAVPIPPAVWLFGSGLLGLIGVARRKTA